MRPRSATASRQELPLNVVLRRASFCALDVLLAKPCEHVDDVVGRCEPVTQQPASDDQARPANAYEAVHIDLVAHVVSRHFSERRAWSHAGLEAEGRFARFKCDVQRSGRARGACLSTPA